MRPHHQAWLAKHKHRSASWLMERIAEGFDVHHIDGNHYNNDPDNLMLVDNVDHLRLHGVSVVDALRLGKEQREKRRAQHGDLYYHRRQNGERWIDMADGDQRLAEILLQRAKKYAHANKLPWPLSQ